MTRYRFEIGGSWDGGPLLPGERARIELTLGEPVRIGIEATAYGDAPPPAPPGRCDGLWNHEVVELFLLGSGERYLELEFGPHGHWLALRLEGRRRLVTSDLALDYAARREGDRWTARASFASALLPPEPTAANAFAIHGPAAARRYLAWQPVPGEAPDFHRLALFAPLARARRPESNDG
ncbi:MAG: hypothetical protein R3F35_07175 [Myxococcota bacterium]